MAGEASGRKRSDKRPGKRKSKPKRQAKGPRRQAAPAVESSWFTRRLAELGETQRALARFLGADPSTVSKMLSGVRRIRLEEAEALARFLRVPLLDVLEHAGVALEGLSGAGAGARLVGTVDGAGRIFPHEGEAEEILLPLAGPLAASHPGLVALRLEDPESLMDGWTFFYTPAERVEAASVGRLSVVRSRGGRRESLALVEIGDALDSFRLNRLDGRGVTARLASAAPVVLIRP